MRLLIILFPLLFMACAAVEPRTTPVVVPPPAPETSPQVNNCAGLSYYQALPDLSAEQQQQALIALRQPLAGTRDPYSKLRLALLLSQGNKEIRNEQEAEGVLKSILDSPDDSQDQALAMLLLEVIGLRKQAKVNLMKMRGLKSRLKQAQKASAIYQDQLSELRSQLQQLQSLEQVIDQQEQAINPPKTGNEGSR